MLMNRTFVPGEHIEFVNYSGRFPNLCSGVLTLRIDGIEYKFGHEACSYNFKTKKYDGEDPEKPNFPKFWRSGGYLDKDYCAHEGEWEIDVAEIPEQFRKYAEEIDTVFNDNVSWGCCGGCS